MTISEGRTFSQVEAQVVSLVPCMPIGQERSATAQRSSIARMSKARVPISWNVKKG